MKTKLLFVFFILSFIKFPIFSDIRTENIDVFILLDKSLSMREDNKIQAVNEYVSRYIIDEVIIPGDLLYIINFFGRTEVFINTIVRDQNHKEELKRRVMGIRADGRFTDIGNALDTLATISAAYEENNRLKYMLLITDGRQEAPPDSIYQWELGQPFNHRFLENTRYIAKRGWKVHILGLGRHTDAQRLAEELSATFSEVDPRQDDSSAAELSLTDRIIAETSDFLSVVRVVSTPNISYRGLMQNPYIEFNTEASFLSAVKNIGLVSIMFTDIQSRETFDIIGNIVDLSFTEDGTRNIRIPVIIPDSLPAGMINGEIRFVYAGQNVLTPSLFAISFDNKSIFSRFMVHFIILGILLLILLLALARSLARGSRTSDFNPVTPIAAVPAQKAVGDGLSFFFYLNGRKFLDIPFTLKNNENIFLNFSPTGIVDLSNKRNDFTKLMLTAKGKILSMEVFDKSLLAIQKLKMDNIIEQSFNFLKKKGSISFKKK
ncbi:MAG: VWA domain-containing protein [Spirochaetaceae bacterium]|nr:VWA domain-containing protein [Spirochaetaceae bacterium]